MQVVEIAVRFGDTTVDVTHLATGSYRIGTAADVDLAVVGLTSFPLVDWTDRGCMLRIPAGAVRRGFDEDALLDHSLVLRRGDVIDLAFDRLAIRVSLISRAECLPRPRIHARWASWVTGALAAHLIALFTIDALATPEVEGVYVPSIVAMLPRPPDPEPTMQARVARRRDPRDRKPRTVQLAAAEPAPQSEPARVERAVAGARRAGVLGSSGFTRADVRAITGTLDLAKAMGELGPLYREHEAETERFGGGRHYVPAPSIATGRYETVSNGRAAGDHYALPGEVGRKAPPRVEHCAGTCVATGGLSRDTIGSLLAQRAPSILGCYERHGGKASGTVVLEIEIAPTGKVARAFGEGLGNTAGCLASVVKRLTFPPAPATTATYSIAFQP